MTTPNLAKIERVALREAWPNEARDLTPLLASNRAEMGDVWEYANGKWPHYFSQLC